MGTTMPRTMERLSNHPHFPSSHTYQGKNITPLVLELTE